MMDESLSAVCERHQITRTFDYAMRPLVMGRGLIEARDTYEDALVALLKASYGIVTRGHPTGVIAQCVPVLSPTEAGRASEAVAINMPTELQAVVALADRLRGVVP